MACEGIKDPSRAQLPTDEGSIACQEAEEVLIPSSSSSMEQHDIRWPGSILVTSDCQPNGCAQSHASSLESAQRPQTNHGTTSPLTRRNEVSSSRLRKGIDSFMRLILSKRRCKPVDFDQFDLRILHEADQFPPITTASLSELDIPRIINKPRMRYDLNLNREGTIGPSYANEMGERKQAESKKYWRALMVELALYMECATKPLSRCLLYTAEFPTDMWRLQKLFTSLREILKTLIRDDDWPWVDELLNVALLMQQLSKGICDIVKLSDWFGRILKGSCSPLRDAEVDATVETLKRAVERTDAFQLAKGLEALFSLFQVMKLDIANHQLRFLRILMISDSIEYVQEHFCKRMFRSVGEEPMLSQESLQAARAWYEGAILSARQEHQSDDSEIDGYSFILLGRGIRNLIRPTHRYGFPVTFEYDYARLVRLQNDYRELLFPYQVSHVFDLALKRRALLAEPDEDAGRILRSRVAAIRNLERGQEHIVLEIVRATYEICKIDGVPSEADLASTRTDFLATRDPSTDEFRTAEKKLSDDLDELLESEINQIFDLPALQIANRYEAPYPPSRMHQSPEMSELQSIADRIARITVLHWRVWARILYHAPSPPHILPRNNDQESVPAPGQRGEEVAPTQTPPLPPTSRPDEGPDNDNVHGRSHDEASVHDAGP